MTIRIVTDSSCDLPQSVADDHGIEIVPLSIRFGDDEYIDRVELTPTDFWAKSATVDTLPETAAPAPGLFEAAYRSLADAGASGIVAVVLSGKMSATKQSAELAARAVADTIEVRVVDSETVSLGVGSIALAAAQVAETGADIDAVEQVAIERVDSTHVVAALDTLENLRKGGRIGNARAYLATALSIKPIIEVQHGEVTEGGKQRTRAKALKFLADRVAKDVDRIDDLAILHGNCADIDDFVARIAQMYNGDIVVGQIGPVVGAHVGLGTIGVAYHTRS